PLSLHDALPILDAIDTDLEMHMRSCRPAGRTLECHGRSARHDLPGAEARSVSGEMAVVSRIAIPVNDHQQISVTDAARVQIGHTRISGDDRRAIRPGDVDAGVEIGRASWRGR